MTDTVVCGIEIRSQPAEVQHQDEIGDHYISGSFSRLCGIGNNHAVQQCVRVELEALAPIAAARVVFDSESSMFVANGTLEDLTLVAEIIRGLIDAHAAQPG